jgi:hypothetical protein
LNQSLKYSKQVVLKLDMVSTHSFANDATRRSHLNTTIKMAAESYLLEKCLR